MTNPPDLYFDRHNNPLQCWIIQQHSFWKQTSSWTTNPCVITVKEGKRKCLKIQSPKFCDKTFCDMAKDTDYISSNLPPNLKLWRLMFFICLQIFPFEVFRSPPHPQSIKEVIFMWFTRGIAYSMNNEERQYSQIQPRKKGYILSSGVDRLKEKGGWHKSH